MQQLLFSFNKILLLITFILLTACGTSTINLSIVGNKHLNQDAENNSLPVMVRIYTLTSTDNFTDASFHELWHNDKETLGNTYIDREEFTINPNSKFNVNISHDTRAKYIGVVALFRHPHGGKWRVIHEIPGRIRASVTTMTISLSGNTVQLK